MPDYVRDRPQLWAGLELFLEAFWCLQTCRTVGMSAGPIPWTAVVQYATIHEFQEDLAEDLEHHVMAMDSAFLEWSNKQKPQQP